MGEKSKRKNKKKSRPLGAGDQRFRVYGLYVVVRMGREELAKYPVQCPKGHLVQYGQVVTSGDGFDAQACCFREMPPLGAVVAFEETTEGVEGHYFFVDDDEFRVLHLEVLTVTFPPEPESQ